MGDFLQNQSANQHHCTPRCGRELKRQKPAQTYPPLVASIAARSLQAIDLHLHAAYHNITHAQLTVRLSPLTQPQLALAANDRSPPIEREGRMSGPAALVMMKSVMRDGKKTQDLGKNAELRRSVLSASMPLARPDAQSAAASWRGVARLVIHLIEDDPNAGSDPPTITKRQAHIRLRAPSY